MLAKGNQYLDTCFDKKSFCSLSLSVFVIFDWFSSILCG